jgi:hypothetical protein
MSVHGSSYNGRPVCPHIIIRAIAAHAARTAREERVGRTTIER